MRSKLTHKEFLVKLTNLNKFYKNSEFKVIGEYQDRNTKILVENSYGQCLVSPSALYLGNNISIRSAIDPHNYFLNVLKSRNELASKKEAEQVALAKAKVATAQGNYDAGVLNAKTKDIMSSPKMLEMMKIENERLMWEGYKAHGKSPFGENNIFGNSNPTLLLNRK